MSYVKIINAAIDGDEAVLETWIRTKQLAEPLVSAMGGLILLAGDKIEANPYRTASFAELNLAYRLFKRAKKEVAWSILNAHPEVEEEVLSLSFIKPCLTVGPLKRLSKTNQARKVLATLLNEASFCLDYQKKGYFNWDNGDAQGAMAIFYGWRQVVAKRRGASTPLSLLRKAGHQLLANAQTKHPQNEWLPLIEYRFQTSWYSPARVRKAAVVPALTTLGQVSAPSGRKQAVQLIALLSLYDAGLRFQQSEYSNKAITTLQGILAPTEPDRPGFYIMKAWAERRGGNLNKSREFISKMKNYDNNFQKTRTAQLLISIDEEMQASEIIQGLEKRLWLRNQW